MEEYIRIAAQVQPLNKFAAMKDIPLLILSGEKDPIIPVNEVKQFYEQLQLLYTCKEDIKHVVYNGVGHIDNLPMNMELAQWFVKYLKP
jgi:alpha-beta hydrolase superfamily lysophospholipase